ncbi:MAG: hypothetical protein KC442_19475 [Thermomicrobiales bacterium]|nr:hypothetical protein [Thermomicrobiales bacterium]
MRDTVLTRVGAIQGERSRRHVVAGFSGAGLGVALWPGLAGKKTRRAVKRAKKRGKKKCRRQEGQCVQVMTDLCNNGNVDPADAAICITKFSACCAFLSDCQTTSFFDCSLAQ